MHGGSAAHVRNAARLRILALVNPALAAMSKSLNSKEPDSTTIAVARDILDRAGLKPPTEITGENGGPIQIVISGADTRL
jgi:hypothetical protein